MKNSNYNLNIGDIVSITNHFHKLYEIVEVFGDNAFNAIELIHGEHFNFCESDISRLVVGLDEFPYTDTDYRT